jgi:hypothetical protein
MTSDVSPSSRFCFTSCLETTSRKRGESVAQVEKPRVHLFTHFHDQGQYYQSHRKLSYVPL